MRNGGHRQFQSIIVGIEIRVGASRVSRAARQRGVTQVTPEQKRVGTLSTEAGPEQRMRKDQEQMSHWKIRLPDFIESLTMSTQQGRICWFKDSNLIDTTLPGGIKALFLTLEDEKYSSPQWQYFAIQNREGAELFRTTPFNSDIHKSSVEELFFAVNDFADHKLPVF
jgi:hypothetical protein